MKPLKLDEHPKIATGFKIPDSYFESFPNEVMRRLESERNIMAPKVIGINRKDVHWVYAAAAILVLSLALPMLNQITKNGQPQQFEIEDYLIRQNISDEEIVSLLEPEDIEKITIDYRLDDENIEEALPADIENYIID